MDSAVFIGGKANGLVFLVDKTLRTVVLKKDLWDNFIFKKGAEFNHLTFNVEYYTRRDLMVDNEKVCYYAEQSLSDVDAIKILVCAGQAAMIAPMA